MSSIIFRFLNWRKNQTKIRDAKGNSSEAASPAAQASPTVEEVRHFGGPHPTIQGAAVAVKLLVLDESADRGREIAAALGEGYDITATASVTKARELLARYDFAIVVTAAHVPGALELLIAFSRTKPQLTSVVLADAFDSDLVINFITSAKVHRLAATSLQPKIFRLAIDEALREHHRRLADLHLESTLFGSQCCDAA